MEFSSQLLSTFYSIVSAELTPDRPSGDSCFQGKTSCPGINIAPILYISFLKD